MDAVAAWVKRGVTAWTAGLLAVLAGAAEPVGDAVPVVEQVALFKNGLAYVRSSVLLPEGARTIRLGQLPIPCHGTFWVSYDPDVPVRALVTSMETVTLPAPARDQTDLLRQNAGREVVIQTENGTVQGVVLAPPQEERQPAPSPYIMDTLRALDERGYPVDARPPAQGALVLVKTAEGLVSLSPGTVRSVRFTGPDVVTEGTVPRRRASLRLELAEPAGGRKVALACLARGMTWTPSYRIDLTDPATARVTGKATVVNELLDLAGVTLELVTGFPNVLFGEVQAPEAMAQNLDGFLTSLARGRDEPNRGTLYLSQSRAPLTNFAGFGNDEAAPVPRYSLTMAGTTAEDLFFYPLTDVRIRRGETASYTLFSADMPYRHLYTWAIPDRLDENARQQGMMMGPGRERQTAPEEVWHSCRLSNTLSMPLTTAPAEFVAGDRFAGQDLCYYTGPGERATIRISRAMNVVAEAAELEAERQQDATTINGYRYGQVTVKGELRVANRQATATALEITKELSGELVESDPTASDTATARGLGRVNPRHVLRWETTVEAGAEIKLTYTYRVYVRD